MTHGKVDANHADLRDNYFRKLAREVFDCSQFGMGFADLLVLTNDYMLYMVEIKNGLLSRSRRRLTPLQKEVALKFGDRFLVAPDKDAATDICLNPQWRDIYTGIEYMKETE